MAAPPFDARRFESEIVSRKVSLGAPLISVAETGSTNDDCLEAARKGAPHGATFVAESQTHGRGRRGRTWTSPPGENLTFSVLLRPKLDPARVAALPLAVGLAVQDALAPLVSSRVGVKWPNDVVAHTGSDGARPWRKLAGVLVESRTENGRVDSVVVGIGINVATRDLPEEISEIATSLALLGASQLGRETLLADVLLAVERRLAVLEGAGLSALLDDLRSADALLGSAVVLEEATGTARGIDVDGALLVEIATGDVRRVMAGAVEWA